MVVIANANRSRRQQIFGQRQTVRHFYCAVQEASENRMLGALLIIDFTDELMIIFLARASPCHKTAVVGRRNLCCQNFGRDECRYLAVSGGIDPIVDEWRSQNNLAARIAYRRSKRSPVPCQHRRRRKERLGIGWILTDNRSLIATK